MTSQSDIPPASPGQIYQRLLANMETVIQGQGDTLRLVLAGLATGGHILIEDNPGTGKTTLAKTLARSIDAQFKRIQFTPDLLPSDIVGVSIFDPRDKAFRLHRGPVFTHILLADEINRASPRTQSALLESMAEGQVSIDGRLMALEDLFFVIATQNPIESRGTYPLPEAQMDRFAMQLSLGYVSRDREINLLTALQQNHPIHTVRPCACLDDILGLQAAVARVFVSDSLKGYIVDLVNATRQAPGIQVGASPRASITLMKTASALALFDGLAFVSPDHIREAAVPVIAHRLAMDAKARFSGRTGRSAVEEILDSVAPPLE